MWYIVQGDKVRLLRLINKGDNAIYVLKEIQITDEGYLTSALSEAQVLKSIDHRYVVWYVDSFMNGNKLYLAMEHCERGDLGIYLSRLG